MSEKPLVSVLMTSFNREDFIHEAIQSVLFSTYKNFELIIVDDGSTDRTVEIARCFERSDERVKVFVNPINLGDYPNRNKAASYAIGKYIKYLDSDDVMYSHCLQVMVDSMETFQHAGYGLSCKGDPLKPYPTCITPHESYTEHFIGFGHFDRAPGSSIIKKAAFDSVNGFSGERMIGDYEFWMRIGRHFPLVKFPIDLYWSRQHSGQESKSDYAKEYDILREKVLNDSLTNKDCPLNENEVKLILQRSKKGNFINKALKFFN